MTDGYIILRYDGKRRVRMESQYDAESTGKVLKYALDNLVPQLAPSGMVAPEGVKKDLAAILRKPAPLELVDYVKRGKAREAYRDAAKALTRKMEARTVA